MDDLSPDGNPSGVEGALPEDTAEALQLLAEQAAHAEVVKDLVPSNLVAALVGRVFSTLLSTEGTITADQLAEKTGLARPLVARATAMLVERGFVSYVDVPSVRGDAPSIPLKVNADTYCVIGVKILPNKLIGVVTDLQAKQVPGSAQHRGFFTRPLDASSPDSVVLAVSTLVSDIRTRAQDFGLPERVVGLGIELSGHVDSALGRVVYSPVLNWPDPVYLGRLLRQATGLVTVVENDANALAIYEHLFGRGVGLAWFGVVLVARGIGCGLILDGHPAHGHSGLAGELGHITVSELSETKCHCGKQGCLESVGSIPAIVDFVNKYRTRSPRVPDLSKAVALAEMGDSSAISAFEAAGDALGTGVAVLLNLLDLERVVVAVPPPLSDSHLAREAFLSALERAKRQHSFGTARDTQVDLQSLTYEHGPVGATAAVVQRFMGSSLGWDPVITASTDAMRGNPASYGETHTSIRASLGATAQQPLPDLFTVEPLEAPRAELLAPTILGRRSHALGSIVMSKGTVCPGAELDPDAESDILAMPPGPTRDTVLSLLAGGEEQEPDEEAQSELLTDPAGGWSVCRVGGYLIFFKPLTEPQRIDRGCQDRHGGLAESLVAAVVRKDDYVHLILTLQRIIRK